MKDLGGGGSMKSQMHFTGLYL